MKTLTYFITISLLIVGSQFIYAQDIQFCNPVTFDFDSEGWFTIPDDLSAYTADGTAAMEDMFWNDRAPIQSPSGAGALLLQLPAVGAPSSQVLVRSVETNFVGQTTVYLSFYQYYRAFNSRTTVRIRQGNTTLQTIVLNEALSNHVETTNAEFVYFDISAVAAGQSNIFIEFVIQPNPTSFEGPSYFWLIDDVQFCDTPPYPETIPDNTVGEYLFEHDYPFGVETGNNVNGSGATAYVPLELVVEFSPTATPQDRIDIRDTLGAVLIDDCVCGKLELWEIDGSSFISNGTGQFPAGPTIDILTNKDGTGAKAKVMNVDLNYYNGVLLETYNQPPFQNLTAADTMGIDPSDPDAYKIAIIDTGIEYDHPNISNFIRRQPNGDSICNPLPDPLGWNFVEKNNNPNDDNSHGTHVAGIIADTLQWYSPECDFEFLSYKAHDKNGVGTLFQVACATYQATLDEADIINDSWGFYLQESPILRAAMEEAIENDVVIVTAAGNDGLDLDTLLMYPACYAYTVFDSIVTVAAVDSSLSAKADFSNFGPTWVDIAAPGEHIESATPSWRGVPREFKSGTSMATPMVTAAIALAHCCNNEDVPDNNNQIWAARDTVLSKWATTEPFLDGVSEESRFLRILPADFCVETNEVVEVLEDHNGFSVYPNPANAEIQILPRDNRDEAVITILDAKGQVITQYQSRNWNASEPQNLNVQHLVPGNYFIRIYGQNYLWTGKLIKI